MLTQEEKNRHFLEVFEKASSYLKSLNNQKAVLDFKLKSNQDSIDEFKKFIDSAKTTLETMRLSSLCLQDLIEVISKKNIERINSLVNSALSSIFFDMNLEFKLEPDIKRNINTYAVSLYKDGEKGTVDNSHGGGITAVIALILKVLFNLFSKRYPFIVLDESLSFLSDKYIPYASKFIKELSDEFGIPIVMVTHQSLFSEYADFIYTIKKDFGVNSSSLVCE